MSREAITIEVELEIVKKEPECLEETETFEKEEEVRGENIEAPGTSFFSKYKVKKQANSPAAIKLPDRAFEHFATAKNCEFEYSGGCSVKTEPPDATRECNTCQRTFLNESLLLHHQCPPQKVADGKKVNIDIKCIKIKNENHCCDNHIEAHEKEKSSDLKTHAKVHTGEYVPCNLNLDIANKIEIEIETGEKYVCEVCNKRFKHKGNFSQHKLVHSGEKPFSCDICEKQFTRLRSLKKHELTHIDKKYICDICCKEFKFESRLTRHIRSHMEKEISKQNIILDQKNYSCNVCNKQFRSDRCVTEHIMRCHGEKRFKCEICEKSFPTKSSLNNHKLIHAGMKYKCSTCKKEFNLKQDLTKHELTHTIVILHVCEMCQKVFETKNNLTVHMRTHSTERFPCDVCNKTFSQKGNLYQHKRLHTGQKNYTCELCEKGFYQKQNLKSHVLRCHGTETFHCGVCKKDFKTKDKFKKHRLSHAREKTDSNQYTVQVITQ